MFISIIISNFLQKLNEYNSLNAAYLTTPAVIEFRREWGAPIVTTLSPGRSLDEEPSFANGKGVLEVIFTIAISECKSEFTTVPTKAWPSRKVMSTYNNHRLGIWTRKSKNGVQINTLQSAHIGHCFLNITTLNTCPESTHNCTSKQTYSSKPIFPKESIGEEYKGTAIVKVTLDHF